MDLCKLDIVVEVATKDNGLLISLVATMALKVSPGSVLVLSAKPLLTKHSTGTLCKHTIRICGGMSRTVGEVKFR